MSKIKSVSTYTQQDESSGYWSAPIPLGADIENIDITNEVQNGTDETSINLNDSDLIIKEGDTGAAALTKFNKLKQRLVNALNLSSNTSIAKAIILAAHPIGSYYWSDNSTNPAELFGGVWQRVKGVFLYAADSDEQAGTTGGEVAHTLTIDEVPRHNHPLGIADTTEGGGTGSKFPYQHQPKISHYYPPDGVSSSGEDMIKSVGGGLAHNNMPPYLSVYCWRRTA